MTANPVNDVLGLLSGYWYSQMLYVMAELGIADCVAQGPKTVEALAGETGCDADSLHRFLRALASIGLLAESSPRRYGPTPLSDTLRSDRADSLRSVAQLGGHPLHWQAWGGLIESVRTGRTAFDAANGCSFFEAMAADASLSATFQQVLDRLRDVDQGVVDAADFGRFRRIVDVGGGAGQLARRIAAVCPAASVTLFDRTHATAEVDTQPAVDFASGDFLDAVPEGADAYILKFVLHDWDDARAVRILRNCHAAMSPSGRVFVVEVIVPESAAPSVAKTHDINMLVLTGGRERTVGEYRSLLRDAGLEIARTTATRHGVSILEARRPPGLAST